MQRKISTTEYYGHEQILMLNEEEEEADEHTFEGTSGGKSHGLYPRVRGTGRAPEPEEIPDPKGHAEPEEIPKL